mmetsp:Transcript_7984/g.11254  ORF Transcript_7984/g.11254 Transcript_7984/m.11254 type:complete len:204 (+) Transcript_7984:14-625(+)
MMQSFLRRLNPKREMCTRGRLNTNPSENSENLFWIIHGFSQLASKVDLEFVLGDIRPQQIECLMNSNLYPVGSFAVKFSQDISFTELKKSISQRHKEKYFLEPNRTSIEKLQKKQSKFLLASHYRISTKTIRCSNVPDHIGMEEMRLHFEEYDLHYKNIVLVPYQQRTQYFLHFESEEEAVRAAIEKAKFAAGFRMRIFHYPM